MHVVKTAISDQPSLPAVDPDEIAFAMALFVAAAKGQVHAPRKAALSTPLSQSFVDLLDDSQELGGLPVDSVDSSTAPTSRAISVLWHHYDGDDRQRAIWSRVVAFHVMLVRGRSSIVEQWTRPRPEDSGLSSFLDSAVVHAVAAAPLGEFGQFNDAEFLEMVGQFTSLSAARPASDSVGGQTVPQFNVFGSLCSAVEAISGQQGVEVLLSRALAGPVSKFPWLKDAQLRPDGLFRGIGKGCPSPSMREMAEAETAVISSFVALLRSLLGHGLTSRLLQTAGVADLSVTAVPDEVPCRGSAVSFGQLGQKA